MKRKINNKINYEKLKYRKMEEIETLKSIQNPMGEGNSSDQKIYWKICR